MNMTSVSLTLSVVLRAMSTLAFGQTDSQKAIAQSDAQKSFDKLKTLAGSWQGHLTTDPHQADMDNAHPLVTLRVTSRGNSLVHEIKEAGTPDDRTRYDHPITMLHLDGDRWHLTPYRNAG